MNLEEKSKLKLIFVDIINGFSHETLEGSKIYLKHLNTFDSGDIESVKDFFHKKAVKAGLPSISDKLKYLEAEDLWTSKEENEIKSIKNFIATLKNTKRKLFKSKDLDSVNGQIKAEEHKLDDLNLQRKKLIGFTAEDYSSKRSNEHIIYVSLYKDSSLKERLFSEKAPQPERKTKQAKKASVSLDEDEDMEDEDQVDQKEPTPSLIIRRK